MRAPKVGILTFSDGRPHVHNELLPLTREFQARLARRLSAPSANVHLPGAVSGR